MPPLGGARNTGVPVEVDDDPVRVRGLPPAAVPVIIPIPPIPADCVPARGVGVDPMVPADPTVTSVRLATVVDWAKRRSGGGGLRGERRASRGPALAGGAPSPAPDEATTAAGSDWMRVVLSNEEVLLIFTF
jgi:hypothetical protein